MRVRAHANKTGHKCRFFYVNSFSYLSPILACSYESEAQDLELRRDNFCFLFYVKATTGQAPWFLMLNPAHPCADQGGVSESVPAGSELQPNPTRREPIDRFFPHWMINNITAAFLFPLPPMNYLCELLEQSLYIGRQFWSVLSYFVYQWQYFTTFCARDQI